LERFKGILGSLINKNTFLDNENWQGDSLMVENIPQRLENRLKKLISISMFFLVACGCSINREPISIGDGKYKIFIKGLALKESVIREGRQFCNSKGLEFHDFGFQGVEIAAEYTFGCGKFTYSSTIENSKIIQCIRIDSLIMDCYSD
jgi:hypothetical protein